MSGLFQFSHFTTCMDSFSVGMMRMSVYLLNQASKKVFTCLWYKTFIYVFDQCLFVDLNAITDVSDIICFWLKTPRGHRPCLSSSLFMGCKHSIIPQKALKDVSTITMISRGLDLLPCSIELHWCVLDIKKSHCYTPG